MAPKPTFGKFEYTHLNAFAAQVDDLENLRIALANRHRVMVTPLDVVDEDGTRRGLGLRADDPQDALLLAPISAAIDGVTALEAAAIKHVQKYMRASPWGPWLADERRKGVGEKQLARLLGATGDPCWHSVLDRPRLVSELWSYTGYAVIDGKAPTRRKGVQANWSDDARKRAWLIASSCVKSGGYYRSVYDATKEHHADAVHAALCVRCGPSGKPAQPGSPISDGHRHARALRAISKELLRDMWIEARKHRGLTD